MSRSSITLDQNYYRIASNLYFLSFHLKEFRASKLHLVAFSFQSLFISDVLLTDESQIFLAPFKILRIVAFVSCIFDKSFLCQKHIMSQHKSLLMSLPA